MKINRKGLELIKKFEGLRLKAYLCPAGKWTIGYGHTGRDVTEGLEITEAAADDLLAEDLHHYEASVESLLLMRPTGNQFSALVCLAYNIGLAAFAKSTLLKKLDADDAAGAADEFCRWTKAGGKELPGLVKRRWAERELFLKEGDGED